MGDSVYFSMITSGTHAPRLQQFPLKVGAAGVGVEPDRAQYSHLRYPDIISVQARRATLSTSRSMPSLGSSRRSQRLSIGGDAKENETAGGIEYSPNNLARVLDETSTERSAASNSYMTSTQMAYMSGEI